ncbi:MAG: four helix bundle protein [Candidatus Saccharibacteria bacterium]|nr:four helix bundle protein [Candidatus Saccharibacteria bacterium]
MSKAAEGYAKQIDRSFRRFLLTAKGSASKVQSMLILADDIQYTSEEQLGSRFTLAKEAAKIIGGLKNKLHSQNS